MLMEICRVPVIFQLVEKMMEQSKEKMNANRGGSQLRRSGSCMW
jgi:hypothetical protein